MRHRVTSQQGIKIIEIYLHARMAGIRIGNILHKI